MFFASRVPTHLQKRRFTMVVQPFDGMEGKVGRAGVRQERGGGPKSCLSHCDPKQTLVHGCAH